MQSVCKEKECVKWRVQSGDKEQAIVMAKEEKRRIVREATFNATI